MLATEETFTDYGFLAERRLAWFPARRQDGDLVPAWRSYDTFLVIELPFGDGLQLPRRAVAIDVHPGLGEHVLVALERPPRLQQDCAGRSRVDVFLKCTSATSPLTWLVMEAAYTGVTVPIDSR
jgi:hypothetical protein